MSSLPDYRPHELMYDKNITDSEFDDFIGVWKNFMPRPLCEDICEFVNTQIDLACVVNPSLKIQEVGAPNHVIKSEDLYGGQLNRKDFAMVMNYADRDLCLKINSVLRTCVKHYISEYQSLMNTKMISSDIKIQKTPPGGGYHLWHYENADESHAYRELVWMIYLNDMPDGEGETEFLYQRRRIKPTVGTVVIWPAGYTHTHKGNTVLTQDKYILTGWYIKRN
jgi:hypothetical protein